MGSLPVVTLVYFVLAAIVAFGLGWFVRGGGIQAGRETLAADWRQRLGALEAERDRLRADLAAAGKARSELQAALDQASGAADDGGGLEAELAAAAARAERLERELEAARRAEHEARAELEHLREQPATADVNDATAGTPPPRLEAPDGEPDDLKRINGIGPGIERTLNGLGIFHYRQIAALTPENVAWVDRHLRFKGRIEREDWIGQARALVEGAST